jgi:AraC-like DNA-binding protein
MEKIPDISFQKPKKDKIEFEIFTLSSLFSRHNRLPLPLDKPHRVNFYQILFISKGHGKHFIDFQSHPYKEKTVLFTSKGQIQAFEIRPETDGFLILFTEAFLSKNMVHSDILSFSRLYNYHIHPPVIQADDAPGNVFHTIIKEIYSEYALSDPFAKEEILRLLLKLLLLKAERIKRTLIPEEKNSEQFKKFGQFRNLVETHYFETRNAKDYAIMMHMSYHHLNEISKSITGNTAKAFIDNFLILEIKRHLAVSDISVKELAYETGFDEPTNFVKYFKKHMGLSPSRFKKRIKKS